MVRALNMSPLSDALHRARRWATARQGGSPPQGFQVADPAVERELRAADTSMQQAQVRAERGVERHSQSWQRDVERARQQHPNFIPTKFQGSAATQKLEREARQALGAMDYYQRKYDALVLVATASRVATEYENRYRESWNRDVGRQKHANPQFTPFNYPGGGATQTLGRERDEAVAKWEQAEKAFRVIQAEVPKAYEGGFNFQPEPETAPAAPAPGLVVTPKKPVVTSEISAAAAVRQLTAMEADARALHRLAANDQARFALEDAAQRLQMAAAAARGGGPYGRGGGMNRKEGKEDTLAHVDHAEKRVNEVLSAAGNEAVRDGIGTLGEALTKLQAQIQRPGKAVKVSNPVPASPPARRKSVRSSSGGSRPGGATPPLRVRGKARVLPPR